MRPSQEIIDISPLISQSLAVFPGDTPFSEEFLMDMNHGDNLTLSKITTTVHLGAHTDAPSHYSANGQSIEARDLHFYMGPVQVVEVNLQPQSRIALSHIKHIKISAERILFKTKSFPNPNSWTNDFNALSPEVVDYLASKNIILIGIDTPSVDLATDKELIAHNAIYKNNIAILEGIILDHVAEGLYDLVALPLKIKGADASPVRAVLIKKGNQNE